MQVISAKFIKLPVSVGMDYNADLQRIVVEIKRDIDALLVPALRAEQPNYVTDATWFDRLAAILRRIRERYESPQFRALADVIARRFVNAVDMRVTKSMGMDVYGNNEALQTVIEASIYDNVRLIKTIPEQYLSQVESIVVTNARAGVRSSAIDSQLTQQFGVTSRRAKFIARDQTAKVNSAVAQKRIVAAGYDYFEWRTSRDARVRDRHTQIANKMTEYGRGIYRYDNPPLSDKGEPILPGTDYQCRCTQRPVSQREVDRNKERGLTAPGVKR
ncbi:head morphogenesis [Vibrio phage CP-T1]|uniref:head morphogenesis n=1 Tax=Vibrio phage CP-T1 TaxID=10689 RepID=UPI0002536CDA|nr:head morphogenesis [Vibrio phage CP-T1]AFC22415.1 putative head protein [Vibrio phage CP-T1]AIA08731.1 putative head protein [Vibrio phage 24]